jgi:hypothetical protein
MLERGESVHKLQRQIRPHALRPIGPIGHRHINSRGTCRFPIERHTPRLVQSIAQAIRLCSAALRMTLCQKTYATPDV